MNKGYPLEHEIEQWVLNIEGKTLDESLESRSFRVPYSGALRGFKGDVRTRITKLPKQLLIECKARKEKSKGESKSFRIIKEWLDKNYDDAVKENMWSVVIISFKGSTKNRLHAIIPLDHFEEMIKELINKNNGGQNDRNV
jgi:hypothetical protein